VITKWRVLMRIARPGLATEGPPGVFTWTYPFAIGDETGTTGSQIGGSDFIASDTALLDTKQWHDVSCDVVRFSCARGRGSLAEPHVPGDASIELRDDGRYSPLNSKSPFRRAGASTLRAGAGVRIEASTDGGSTWSRMWTGFVRTWPITGHASRVATITVLCHDWLGVLAERDVGVQEPLPAQTSEDRVYAWLDAARVPRAEVDIAALTSFTHVAGPLAGKALDGLRGVVSATLEDLYCDRDGKVVLRSFAGELLYGSIIGGVLVPETPTLTVSHAGGSAVPHLVAPTVERIDPVGQAVYTTTAAGAISQYAARVTGAVGRVDRRTVGLLTNEMTHTAAKRRVYCDPSDDIAVRSVSFPGDHSATSRAWCTAADRMRAWVRVDCAREPTYSLTSTEPAVYETYTLSWTRYAWVRHIRHEVDPGRNLWTCTLGLDDAAGLGSYVFIS
jgi:hypothetical protein